MLYALSLKAQATFTMSNDSVSACEGILYDSGAGQIFGHYDHNEDYTFTICVPGSGGITMVFTSFCTEVDFDSLRIFDGSDTLAPQLGPTYHGVNSPGTVVSQSECISLHFRSDNNVTCGGWQAYWFADIGEPELPEIQLDSISPSCNTTELKIRLTDSIACSELIPNSFRIEGPTAVQVTQTSAAQCLGDSTNEVRLVLSPGLVVSGEYIVWFESGYEDLCGDVRTLQTSDTLWVDNCPLEMELRLDRDTICVGECVNIRVEPGGGNLESYSFQWNQGLPTFAGPISVCPTTTTTYVLNLSDDSGVPGITDSIVLYVRPQPTMPQDTIVCASAPEFSLTALPDGGFWQGQGIQDMAEGLFLADSAQSGSNSIQYTDPFGCTNTMIIEVNAIDAGRDQAACPGADPFVLEGFEPSGGNWSGSWVNDTGLFTPAVMDSFELTYSVNGCTDVKKVYVDSIQIPSGIDTLCESSANMLIPHWPPGGVWHGPGIIDSLNGIFSPAAARFGLHTLTYSLAGCSDTLQIYVIALSIGGNRILCPDNGLTWLGSVNPTGGIWTGLGIVDPDSGLYDPGFTSSDFTDTITYTYDGCSASRLVLIRETVIGVDTVRACLDEAPIVLNWDRVRNRPYNGLWSGPGIIFSGPEGQFHPAIAGRGLHTVYFEANGCQDSLTILVYENAILTDTAICVWAQPFFLASQFPGGAWSGTGVLDSSWGLFDPEQAGVGAHYIYYRSPFGCLDSAEIIVFEPDRPLILGLSGEYCHTDTLIPLRAEPPGGTFSGPGILGNGFNPSLVDSGKHLIYYSYEIGGCTQTAEAATYVNPPLQAQAFAAKDTVCRGETVALWVQAAGGAHRAYRYFWTYQDLIRDSIQATVFSSSDFTVIVEDGCSMPDTATAHIHVKNDFEVNFITSDTVCQGDMGFAAATVSPPGAYWLTWESSPVQLGDTLKAPAHFYYKLHIEDLQTGCQQDAWTGIPSYPFVHAAFSPNPNNECRSTVDPTFTFLDLSQEGVRGHWDFGDGTQVPYQAGINPTHTFPAAGEFTVMLFIENRAGCTDSVAKTVCVLPEASKVQVPNAFSPNGDGVNDTWRMEQIGLLAFQLQIFDRWGKRVYTTEDIGAGWDGTFANKAAPPGVYTYLIQGTVQSTNSFIDYGPEPFMKVGTVTLIR